VNTEPTGYTVCVEGVTEPGSFRSLGHALGSLWTTLRILPIGWAQYEAYRYFFGPGAVERTEALLERDGEMVLAFTMAGRSHAVRLRRGADAAPQLAPKALPLLDNPEVAALLLHEDGPCPHEEEGCCA
jgi:hypothetical protein